MHVMGRPPMELPRGTVQRSEVVTMPPALVLLVIMLSVAAIGLGPTTAHVCAGLEDFPCGP